MSILTQEQAKGRWCPLARVLWTSLGTMEDDGVAGASYNRTIPDDSLCIASGCMAWRPVERPGSDVEVGFCGAFGKPAGA